MAQQTINIGSTPNDGTGDPLRNAFNKANLNFTELYGQNLDAVTTNGATTTNAVTVGGLHINSTDAVEMPTGTDGERPSPVAGMFRFNTTSNEFEGYDGTEWGAIGGTGSSLVQDNFTGNNSTTDFTLSVAPTLEIFTSVYVSGVYQQKDTYSIAGTTLSLSEAPASGDTIEVITIDNIALEAAVTSVNGLTGAVVLDSDDVSEGATNKYLLDDSVTYNKVADEFKEISALTASATVDMDFNAAQVFNLTPNQNTTINITNPKVGLTKVLVLTGGGGTSTVGFTVGGASGTFNLVGGEYDDTASVKNFVQLICVNATEFWYSISQIA